MTARSRAQVELRFADGSAISAWESFQIRESFIDPLGSFSFTVAPPKDKRPSYRDKLRKGEQVSLLVNGARQATALVTTIEQEIGDQGYTLSVDCQSTLVAAYEASVDPYIASTFQTYTPIGDAALSVLGPFGFDSIVTDTTAWVTAVSGKALSGRKTPPVLDVLTHRDMQANPGESAYGFCARLFNRVGLALRTDHAGKLLLGAPDYEQGAAYTVVQEHNRSHAGDRMLRRPPIRIRDTNESQFSEVVVAGRIGDRRGTTSAATPTSGIMVEGIARPGAAPFSSTTLQAVAPARHSYRGPWKPKYFIYKKARDKKHCANFAQLMIGVRAGRAFQVRCAVDGLVSTSGDRVWAVDTVGRVIVEEAGIDENMWLLETVKIGDRGGGQMTELIWIPLGSLVLGEAA